MYSARVDLLPFYFAHPHLFLLPIEHLSPRGLSEPMAALVESRAHVAPEFRTLFNDAFSRQWKAAAELSRIDPDSFPPPRLVNIAVATGDERMHPYYQPFEGISVFMYAGDFDPRSSSLEHAVYQLMVAERLGQTRRASAATMSALVYLLRLNADQRRDFCEGAARSTRPDSKSAQLIAEHLEELRAALLVAGIDFQSSPPESHRRIKDTPLAVRRDFIPALQELVKQLDQIAADTVDAYYERQAKRPEGARPEQDVIAFLRAEIPRVLVVSKQGDILWDPKWPEQVEHLEPALQGIGERPAQSLIEDLRAVGDVSDRFFNQIKGSERFRIPVQSLEEAGGVYLNQSHKLIAYALEQPGLSPLREEAPPYHRLLLIARAMHEWGHVAVEANVIFVPPGREDDFEAKKYKVADLLWHIADAMPKEVQPLVEEEMRDIKKWGTHLSDLPFARNEDYRSNMMCKRLLAPEPVQAYARANIRSLAAESIGLIRKLARYAYEAQYLWLAEVPNPWEYFMAGTYFREEYIEPGLLGEEDARSLFSAVAEVCGCYAFDEKYFC